MNKAVNEVCERVLLWTYSRHVQRLEVGLLDLLHLAPTLLRQLICFSWLFCVPCLVQNPNDSTNSVLYTTLNLTIQLFRLTTLV